MLKQRQDAIRGAIKHTWDNYHAHAWGQDNADPVETVDTSEQHEPQDPDPVETSKARDERGNQADVARSTGDCPFGG